MYLASHNDMVIFPTLRLRQIHGNLLAILGSLTGEDRYVLQAAREP